MPGSHLDFQSDLSCFVFDLDLQKHVDKVSQIFRVFFFFTTHAKAFF